MALKLKAISIYLLWFVPIVLVSGYVLYTAANVFGDALVAQHNAPSQAPTNAIDQPSLTPTATTPSLTPDPTPKPAQVTNSGHCIIRIEGQNYDVTRLRKTHTGGDIFVCGTDMTTVYVRQHGTSVARIAQYRTSASLSSGSTTTLSAHDKSYMEAMALVAKHASAKSCYVAFNGKIYDVTHVGVWQGCTHGGVHGGIDITAIFPHNMSYLAGIPVVKSYYSKVKPKRMNTILDD